MSLNHLELNSIADMAHTQWAVGAKDDLFLEHLHPMLKVSGSQQHVPPDQFMLRLINILCQVVLPGNFHLLSAPLHSDCDLLLFRIEHKSCFK